MTHPYLLESISKEDEPGRQPSSVVAFLLGLFAPGLGHFYSGRPRRGVAGLIIFSLLLFPLAYQIRLRLSVHLPGYVLGHLISLVILISVAVDGALVARRRTQFRPGRMDRWYLYVAWFVAAVATTAFAYAALLPRLPYRLFRIPTSSMLPTLLAGDSIVGRMQRIDVDELERGLVVIFEPPDLPDVLYTDRIVGLPGEVIEIRRRQVLVNGDPIEEPYKVHETEMDADAWKLAKEGLRPSPVESGKPEEGTRERRPDLDADLFSWGPIRIPEESVLVLGDNRDNSRDSRFFGPVPVNNLRGRAIRIYLSTSTEDPPVNRWWRTGMKIR